VEASGMPLSTLSPKAPSEDSLRSAVAVVFLEEV